MSTDIKREILLLDSTLGVGGKLIDWNYGETAIPNIHRLSITSGLDIVEYGLLSAYPLGPDHAVYKSTALPPAFEKMPDQQYALFLDPDYWPDISCIPNKSISTADMIRVPIFPDHLERALAYCSALSRKGYHISVLLEEIGQYTRDELSLLIQKVNTVAPWVCCLFDTSGVLTEKDLADSFSLCDELLAPSIRIGLHGCDNLQCLFGLAKTFCTLETERGLCVDVSAGGMGAGALHLSSMEFAKWINDTFHRNYDLPVLAFEETYTKLYLESKQESATQLLYYTAAKNKCSYRYTEYYCDLQIEPADQLEIYKEIERKFAFQFDKSAANRALLRYRKKRLNLAVVIPTANHPSVVFQLLCQAAKDLLCFGVDIVIYDSSDDEQTHAVTMNFQIDGYDNVHYRRYTGELDGLSIDRKVLAAYSEYLDRDYIWLCRDGLIPTISQFYNELVELAEKGTEFITVDWSERNNGRHCVKNYDDCVEFFLENVGRMNTLGCSIFSGSFMRRLLHDRPLDKSNYGFWVPIAAFHQMAVEPVLCGLIISNVFTYNSEETSPGYWVKGMLKIWGENWYRTISGLPAVYDVAKPSVLKIHASDFQPFTVKSMLMLRSTNDFNLSIYREYREILSQVSINSPSKFYFAALIPKSVAKWLLKMESYWTLHPDSLFAKLISKLYYVYVRLGR